MIKQILRIMRILAGFGAIWVANGGHFGRLTGYFRFSCRLPPCRRSFGLLVRLRSEVRQLANVSRQIVSFICCFTSRAERQQGQDARDRNGQCEPEELRISATADFGKAVGVYPVPRLSEVAMRLSGAAHIEAKSNHGFL